ncbi:protein boule-like isoform X3 [Frankliniella occidentalis]|uniref:Protein boule-like isoform X3 n=2 Tax=Frankliniella occidentalis TaxID=133901 RepID=A0A9C6X4M6_FRAOC|nr:protein boule-like isoform X3 [Frankliniella occidentalis]
MTSFYNGVPHSSSVSEISTAPPSPVSCGTGAPSATSPANASRYGGVVVPNRVFVGGIASNTTETELQELFSQFGNIQEIKIISDRGGVCKGYGFVTFETEEEAKKVQHQPDSIVLKERRLNIAPAVMKQQPFARSYDIAPSPLLYHNGTTTYTYQNGMAFFAAQATQPQYATREAALYSAPFGANQTTPNPTYPQIMYAPYTPPMQYLAAGQQYQYPMPFDYFKAVGPTSQYIYAPPSALNGALNNALNGLGGSSQSPSPGYGPPSASGPPGGELFYSNGISHPTPLQLPHQSMYPMEQSPAHSEVTPAYSSIRQPPLHQQHHHQSFNPRRGGGTAMRNTGPRTYMGSARGNPHHNNSNYTPSQILGSVPTNGQNSVSKSTSSPKNTGESVNGTKTALSAGTSPPPSVNHGSVLQKQEKVSGDQGGAGDASTIRHALPLSPPNTPLPQDTGASITTGGSDGDSMCQKMKTLAL